MRYLVDTNVVSELRKGSRANDNVRAWFDAVEEESLFLSVLVVGEIRRGIESVRRRDRNAAMQLERWLRRVVQGYGPRILPISAEVAEAWGRLNVPDPLPVIDSLLAATALVHDFTLVTRNVTDLERAGVPIIDPFRAA